MDHGPGEHDIDIKFVQADLPNKADMFNLDAQPRGVDGASLLRGEAERAVIRRCGSKRGVRQGYFRTRRRERRGKCLLSRRRNLPYPQKPCSGESDGRRSSPTERLLDRPL